MPTTIALSLSWILGGAVLGTLAHVAAPLPGSRRWPVGRAALLSRAGIGAVSALAGGWLGSLLLGRLFGSPAAIWVAVLAVMLLPWLMARWRLGSVQ